MKLNRIGILVVSIAALSGQALGDALDQRLEFPEYATDMHCIFAQRRNLIHSSIQCQDQEHAYAHLLQVVWPAHVTTDPDLVRFCRQSTEQFEAPPSYRQLAICLTTDAGSGD